MGQRAPYDPPDYAPRRFDGGLGDALRTEFSGRFVDAMRNRMIVSFHKYGPVADGYPDRVDALASLEGRLARYRETGNAEWLVDAANFAMIEFMHPRHPGAHFRPTDAHESPGRARLDGRPADAANAPPDAAVDSLRARLGREGD